MSSLPPGALLLKACAKCHARKVKCDGRLPRCTNCSRAESTCNVSECVVWSHEHVTELQARIRWLEELVLQAYTVPGDIRDTPLGTRLERKSAAAQQDQLAEEVGLLSLRAGGSYMGSMSGVTFSLIISSAIGLFQSEPIAVPDVDPEWPLTTTRASFPPATVARRYVGQYLERVHRWHPFLDLDRLACDLEEMYTHQRRGDEFTRLSFFLIFAIGSQGDSGDDAFTSAEYFRTGLGFVPAVMGRNNLDALRSLLLLTAYGLASWDAHDGPNAVNLWFITGHAVRMAVQLGITRNNPKWEFGSVEQEERRRVFWSLYGLERFVASITGRTISLRREAIDAHLPQRMNETCPPLANFLQQPVDIDLRPGFHLMQQRQILSEVLECVYHARTPNRPGPSENDTTAGVFQIQAHLVSWAQEVYIVTLDNTVERTVLLLAFHQATILLHRPSPSFPAPPPEALDVCLGAARETIKICTDAVANGAEWTVCPGWQGFASILSAGLVLLYCSWSGPTCPQAIKSTLDPDLVSSLATLEMLSVRRPAALRYISLYRQVIDAFGRILATQAASMGAVEFDMHASTSVVAAALENSGLGSLGNLDLDAESIEFIARLLWGEQT